MSCAQRLQNLDDFRDELIKRRLATLGIRGIYLDTSPPGAGKSHADMALARAVGKSVNIVPSHKNCKEGVAQFVSAKVGIVAAYPKLDEETCSCLDRATRAIECGLSPTRAVCARCPSRPLCDYQAQMEEAMNAEHVFLTHRRAELSAAENYVGNRRLILMHEDATNVLCPKIEISGVEAIQSVQLVLEQMYADVGAFRLDNSDNAGLLWFLWRSVDICLLLERELLTASESRPIALPATIPEPLGIDAQLFEAIEHYNLHPDADGMRLIRWIMSGHVGEIMVTVDQYQGAARKLKCRRCIVAVHRRSWPQNVTMWIEDATANRESIERMLGRSVVDCTPKGRLRTKWDVVQVPLDITRRKKPDEVIKILRAIIFALPGFSRIGVICHRKHVPCLTGKAAEGAVPEASLRCRIVKVGYFHDGASRGSNAWYQECDCLIVLGTPRVPPHAKRQRLMQTGALSATLRPESWTEFARDHWFGKSAAGKTAVVPCMHCRDRDWHEAYHSLVVAELMQAVGRGRSILDDGIPVVVVSNEPLPGIPLADMEISPLNDKDLAILDFMYGVVPRMAPLIADGELIYRNQSLNSKYLANGCVSTAKVADALGCSTTFARERLCSLERSGLVERVGERQGWKLPATQPSLVGRSRQDPNDAHTSVLSDAVFRHQLPVPASDVHDIGV